MASAPTVNSMNLDDLFELGAPDAAGAVEAPLTLDNMLGSCASPPCLALKLGFDMSDGFAPLVSLEPELCCI